MVIVFLRALNALVEIASGVEQSVIKHEAACNDSMLLSQPWSLLWNRRIS